MLFLISVVLLMTGLTKRRGKCFFQPGNRSTSDCCRLSLRRRGKILRRALVSATRLSREFQPHASHMKKVRPEPGRRSIFG
jgi:hypothetical protein